MAADLGPAQLRCGTVIADSLQASFLHVGEQLHPRLSIDKAPCAAQCPANRLGCTQSAAIDRQFRPRRVIWTAALLAHATDLNIVQRL